MKYLHQNKHWSINKEYNLDKLLYIMIDRPKYIINNNNFIWTNEKNQAHRNYDLPADIHFSNKLICNICWFVNHIRHRENNKPAYVGYNNCKKYYTLGKIIRNKHLK